MTVEPGRYYRNRNGDTVLVKALINKHHPSFGDGFRVVDDSGRVYQLNGKWSSDPFNTGYDLIRRIKRVVSK